MVRSEHAGQDDDGTAATWVGDQSAQPAEEFGRAGAAQTRWWLVALGLAAVLFTGVGFLIGWTVDTDPAPNRPAVAAPGVPGGFDTRTPAIGADGTEQPFINIRYYAFDLTPGDGFRGRCGHNALLFVLGDATSCAWAGAVVDRFIDHEDGLDLGYEPSFDIDGIETYCHYQNPGIFFVGDDAAKGFPVWECRADGGRQFVFSGVTMSMIPPMECWREDGTLSADMGMFAGSPAAAEIPRTRPDHPTLIPDCEQ